MSDTVSFGKEQVTFTAAGVQVSIYTLTTGLVASNPVEIKFAKKLTVYPYYTPGAGGNGNYLSYQVEINPFPADQDPTDAYWSAIGKYTDTAGTWVEEPATFLSAAGTAGTQKNVTPLDVVDIAAYRVRIKAKETVVGGVAGTVKFILGTNTIN